MSISRREILPPIFHYEEASNIPYNIKGVGIFIFKKIHG